MPLALSTTKRKFHDILESIANPPLTSPSANHRQHNASNPTLPETHEPSAKRPKHARPTSYPLRANLNRTMRSASTATAPRPLTSSTVTEEKKPPNFAPWDRNQFLSRLETFRHVDKWMSKPDPISEVQWAKRGWRCVGKERVGCVGGCGNEVVISLEPSRGEEQTSEGPELSEDAEDDYYDWREEAQKELVHRYTDMIVTEHDEGCLWRRRGCDGTCSTHSSDAYSHKLTLSTPDSIYRLPLAHQAITFQSLRQRYESLCNLSADLPSSISQPSALHVSRLTPHLFHVLYPHLKSTLSTNHPPSSPIRPTTNGSQTKEPNTQPTINSGALILALTGWQADPDSPVSGIATCTSCFRRLGLWLFKTPSPSPPASSPSHPTSEPAPASPTRSDPVINRLDPLTEHRTYCPWINAQSQSRSPLLTEADLPGWEILRDMVMRIRPPAGLNVPGTPDGDQAMGSVDGGVDREHAEKSKEEKDKERWARLKKLKQVFRVRRKPKGGDGEKGNEAKGGR